MSPDRIRDFMRRRPFEPFKLRLTNGEEYVVRHPDNLIIDRATAYVGIPSPDLPEGVYDRIAMVSLLHVVEIIPLMPAAPAA